MAAGFPADTIDRLVAGDGRPERGHHQAGAARGDPRSVHGDNRRSCSRLGRDGVRKMDAVLANRLASNAPALAAWKAASRVQIRRQGPSGGRLRRRSDGGSAAGDSSRVAGSWLSSAPRPRSTLRGRGCASHSLKSADPPPGVSRSVSPMEEPALTHGLSGAYFRARSSDRAPLSGPQTTNGPRRARFSYLRCPTAGIRTRSSLAFTE